MDMLIIGHVNIDHHGIITKAPIKSGTSEITIMKDSLGGTATNIALIASKLDLKVGINAPVGIDFSEEYEHLLESYGIDITNIKKIDSLPTPSCWIFETVEGDTYTFIYQGSMLKFHTLSPDMGMINKAAIIHMATAEPLYLEKVKNIAIEKNKMIALDPGPEIRNRYDATIFREMIRGVNFLFLNRAEADIAKSYLSINDDSGFSSYIDHIIITSGKNGVTYISKEGVLHYPTDVIERYRTTVGAGDAFRAGFWAAYNKGYSIDKSIKIGQKIAYIAIEKGNIYEVAFDFDRIASRL
ncbi:MAG: PfkB family carbohydrate kinase [Candidatus Thermoplasmatota archaeon]|jgi:6-phosphofructokinase 1/ribokinase|nr:PfkB family carbohydrate kinase [Candidatus Thermoplasmatota archaeon]MCL5963015.1 PfkB family carbohydrate kinase [Candidatus Thermoplasmatota archaeon]